MPIDLTAKATALTGDRYRRTTIRNDGYLQFSATGTNDLYGGPPREAATGKQSQCWDDAHVLYVRMEWDWCLGR